MTAWAETDTSPPLFSRVMSSASADLHDLRRRRALFWYLVVTRIKQDRADAFLGILWWILNPLLLMCVYWLFIGLILGRGSEPNFPLFVLIAFIVFGFFSQTVTESMSLTLAKERSMHQIAYPKTVIPLAAAATGALRLVTALGAYLLLFEPVFGVHPRPVALLAIPFLLLELAFALGVAFLFSALNMFFRDTSNLVDHTLWLWLHLSPCIYTVERIPPGYQTLFQMNPMATVIEAVRNTFLYGQMPGVSLAQIVVLCVLSLLTLTGGYLFFVNAQHTFPKLAN
jgi:homopolymeric O-antigen transport system permease protein